MSLPGKVQDAVCVPSQEPPQLEPSLAQATRLPCGASPAVSAVQVPWLPGTSHAWHWPLQAVSQQKPSVQWPLPHWSSLVQTAVGPGSFFGRQRCRSLQKADDEQSASPLHSTLQAVPAASQANGPQEMPVTDAQAPSALQLTATVATPLVHDAGAHCVLPPGKSHDVALVPSQVPPQSEPLPAQVGRRPCGSPEVSVVQLPTWPATSQAWHWPLQAVAQQTPSVQTPLPHSSLELQRMPLIFTNEPVRTWPVCTLVST
jgi:hypothetical protein